MARQLSEGPGTSSFADGAARFAEIARKVKAQQIAEGQGLAQPSPTTLEPPEDAWARRFASLSIGPTGSYALTTMAPVPHRQDYAPDFSSLRPALARKAAFSRKAEIAPEPVAPRKGAPMDMRLARKEEPRRRSWLGRLFRGA